MAFVWLQAAVCVRFLLPSPDPAEAVKSSAASGEPELTSQPRGTPLAVLIPRVWRFLVRKRSWVSCVAAKEVQPGDILPPELGSPGAVRALRGEIPNPPLFPAPVGLDPQSWSARASYVDSPRMIPLTDMYVHKGPCIIWHYFAQKSACAGINRILLVPRTDDSLTAWCVEEGSLQTSRREPCRAVEGNEACPAVIVLIALGFPRDGTSPSWDLSLAKHELTHILFLLVLLLVCYCSNCDVACKQTAAIILFTAIEG